MRAYVYILYSNKLNRYYIGSTELNPKKRLELHLSKNYGRSKFTAKVNDWMIFDYYQCSDISIARKVEKYLKQMKSRKFVESLKDNPGKWNWIIDRL